MKRLLLSSICLFLFAASILMVQLSCSKMNAQMRPVNNLNVGKIFIKKYVAGVYQVWSANYDGTNQMQIQIALPANVRLWSNIYVSPDGQKLFFIGVTSVNNYSQPAIYSCDADGTNVQLLIQGTGGSTPDIREIYQVI